jgi:hypothetical protein
MIVGATKILDDNGFHKKDYRNRYMWNMPDPIGEAEHKFTVKEKMQFGEKVVKVPQTKIVKVPVYRGYSERLINYAKSQRALMMRENAKRVAAQGYAGAIHYDPNLKVGEYDD